VRDDIASEVIAKYAFMGPRVELERTLPLEPGEILIVGMIARTRYGDRPFGGGRRGFLRLSTRRLCIVRHYGFIRDRIIVIPPRAIAGVAGGGPGAAGGEPTESVRITFNGTRGQQVITIVTWRRPPVPTNRTVLGANDLAEPFRMVALALDPAPANDG
jgi:hypothetical protein